MYVLAKFILPSKTYAASRPDKEDVQVTAQLCKKDL